MLPRVRLAGLALALAGVALLVYAFVAEPLPTDFPTAFRSGGPGDAAPARLLVHGPALAARFDEESNTTFAVFDCMGAHIMCDAALALAGDQRAAVSTDGLLLRPREGATFSREPLDEPLPMPYGEDVGERLAGAYDVAYRWPGAAARILGVGALLAGAALAAGARSLAVGAAASTVLVAVMLGTNEASWVILSQGLVVLLTLAGLVTLLAAWRSPRARAAGLALLAYAPVLIGVFASGALAFYPLDSV